jgi:stearoyl-CoA desaturase (delta-9 desaturase)
MFGVLPGSLAWATHIMLYVSLNAMVNGLGHAAGSRNYDNSATNLRWLALVTAGEGLHNNHHEFPASARFSRRRGEFDPAWPIIKCLVVARLARIVQLSRLSDHGDVVTRREHDSTVFEK